jgi:hypothetical protein
MRKVLLVALGAAALAYVFSRRRAPLVLPSANGPAPAGSDELRRFVEASERLHST